MDKEDREADVRTATRTDRFFLPDEKNLPTQLEQMHRSMQTAGTGELGNAVRAVEARMAGGICRLARRVRSGGESSSRTRA